MILKNLSVTIPRDQVLLNLKFNVKTSQETNNVTRLIDEMLDEGAVLVNPRAAVKTMSIRDKRSAVTTFDDTAFVIPSAEMAKLLVDCCKVTLLICTIGDELEQKTKALIVQKELTRATILDAVASEAVEALTDKVNELVRQEANGEGAKLTRRFSPGYGDWNISEHKNVLAILNAETIGVTVNEQHLMQPEKTVSACIGWIKEPNHPVRDILGKAE